MGWICCFALGWFVIHGRSEKLHRDETDRGPIPVAVMRDEANAILE